VEDIDTLTLTTARAESSYGVPVLVIEGEAYGPADMTPAGVTGAELVTAWAARFCGPDWQDTTTNPYLLSGAELDRAIGRATRG
jgi:hypothetical protein